MWVRSRAMTYQIPNISPSVRAEMARRGETQTTLAAKIGLTQSGLSRRLTGEAEWTINDIYGLAAVFGVPLSTFLPDLSEKASA